MRELIFFVIIITIMIIICELSIYIDFISARRFFCKEKLKNKKCDNLSKQCCMYRNKCKYVKRVEE